MVRGGSSAADRGGRGTRRPGRPSRLSMSRSTAVPALSSGSATPAPQELTPTSQPPPVDELGRRYITVVGDDT